MHTRVGFRHRESQITPNHPIFLPQDQHVITRLLDKFRDFSDFVSFLYN